MSALMASDLQQRLVAHAHDVVAHLARGLRPGEPALDRAAGDIGRARRRLGCQLLRLVARYALAEQLRDGAHERALGELHRRRHREHVLRQRFEEPLGVGARI
jgi:hypothetical protein